MQPNFFSDSAHLIGEISWGTGNIVSPGVVIVGPITIGDNNFFGPGCVIGTPPQDDLLSFEIQTSFLSQSAIGSKNLSIGNHNVFREFVTINRGLTSTTTVGNHGYFMAYAHVAHDAHIGDHVKIANAVQMGGFTTIMDGAYVGLSAVIHQFGVIGSHAMIGMGSIVKGSICPAVVGVGSPCLPIKLNRKALDRLMITDSDWEEDYLRSPSEYSIHAKLSENYRKFRQVVEKRNREREEVARFRGNL